MKPCPSILALLLLVAASVGCNDRSEAQSNMAKPATQPATQTAVRRGPVIVATIHPLATLAGELASDWSEVHSLFPTDPNVDRTRCELTSDRLALLTKADVFLFVGEGFDDDALRAFERVQGPAGRRAVSFATLTGLDKVRDENVAPTKPASEHRSAPTPAVNSIPQPTVVRAPTPVKEPTPEPSDSTPDESDKPPTMRLNFAWHNMVAPWLNAAAAEQFVGGLADALMPLYPDKRESLRARSQLLRANLIQYDRTLSRMIADAPSISPPADNDPINAFVQRYGLRVSTKPAAHGDTRPVIDPFGSPDLPDRRTYQQILDYNLNLLLRPASSKKP